MIELDDVAFGYGARTLFSHLRVRVAPGSLCGVLGPNGAGKSTLLRIALGLLSPASGRALVGDRAIATLPRREAARAVAALLQDEAMIFPMTVAECVLLGRSAHLPAHGFETADDLAAADAAMDEVDVRPFADRLLETLSGGERRRVLLARAFAQTASALVLDEPAANLDLAHQLDLFALLRRRADAGSAILVSVHDLNLAARSCDQVLLLDGKGGHVQGTPAEVLTPAHVAVAYGVEVELGRTTDGAPYFVPVRVSR
jgi:iron complex transport system ATP-binding protein